MRARCREIGGGEEIQVEVVKASSETGTRGNEMQIAMCNALALMCWQSFRFLQDFSSRDFTWLFIGVLLTVVVMWVVARRRRRWF